MLRRNLLLLIVPVLAAGLVRPATGPSSPAAIHASSGRAEAATAPLRGPSAAAEASGALRRVAVLGASASAGFLLPTDLGEALELLIACEHQPVLSTATSSFFTAPDMYARIQVAQAQTLEPTTVIGIDFLFWFTYGAVGGDTNRPQLLERGLPYLDSFDCPVLTSTVPDMRAAVGRMLWPNQVPAPETLAALNRRIEAWAAERDNVVLVSLPEWHAQLVAREGFEIGGKPWPRTPDAPLLQYDQLHPNADGLALLACKVLESLIRGGAGVAPEDVRLDPALVADPVHARMQAIVGDRD